MFNYIHDSDDQKIKDKVTKEYRKRVEIILQTKLNANFPPREKVNDNV